MKKQFYLPLVFVCMLLGVSLRLEATIYRLGSKIVYDVDLSQDVWSWNTLANGGAEAGNLSNWFVNVVYMMDVQASTEQVALGDYSFKATAKENMPTWGAALIYQNRVHLSPGEYVLSALFFFDGSSGVGTASLDLNDETMFWPSGGKVGDNFLADPSHPGWQLVIGEFSTDRDIWVRPRVVRDNGVVKGTVVFFDEVALTPKENFYYRRSGNVVPEPANSMMFLLGLVGYLGSRRKTTRNK